MTEMISKPKYHKWHSLIDKQVHISTTKRNIQGKLIQIETINNIEWLKLEDVLNRDNIYVWVNVSFITEIHEL